MERTYDFYTTDRETGRRVPHIESHDAPLFTLPSGWEAMSKDELDRWATMEANRRRAWDRALPVQAMCQTDGCEEAHEHRSLAPTGDMQAGRMPLVGDKVDRSHLYDMSHGCPVCESSYIDYGREDGDECPSCTECGYNAEFNLWVDTEITAATRPGFKALGGVSTYHDYEQAAERVTYHEGEPITSEEVISGDEYPKSWDYEAIPTTVRPTPQETARTTARGRLQARLERMALRVIAAELDATIV
jgi:hypothetical protein